MAPSTVRSSSTPLQEILGVASGSGIFTQTGGVNLPYAATPLAVNINFNALEVGYSNGGYGEYNLQGGTVGAAAIYVGGNVASQYANGVLMQAGTGVFNQTGGAVGSYGINGFGSSANNAVGLTVGGVVGGTSVGRGNYCSSVGTYNLGNGTSSPLLVGGCEVVGASGTGTFTQNSGTNAIVGGGLATWTMGAAGVYYNNAMGALFLGWYAEPTGRASAYYGNGVGTYNLNGGLLTGGPINNSGEGPVNGMGGYEVLGVGGTGIFNQTGGTNISTFQLDVGGCPTQGLNITLPTTLAAYGAYTLSGGLLQVPVSQYSQGELVGFGGRGIFNQTGGTNLAYEISLAGYIPSGNSYIGTPGTYNLNGGLLQANTITQNTNFGAVATFNFNAGTLQASPQGTVNHPAGLVNAMQITVGTAASNVATVDANGQTVTLNGYAYPYPGALSGPGQLRVIDSVGGGTVTLGGSDINGNPMSNYYTGGTTVLSGTLEVLYAQALPNVGVLTIGGPGQVVRAAFNLNGTQQTTRRARHRIEPGPSRSQLPDARRRPADDRRPRHEYYPEHGHYLRHESDRAGRLRIDDRQHHRLQRGRFRAAHGPRGRHLFAAGGCGKC